MNFLKIQKHPSSYTMYTKEKSRGLLILNLKFPKGSKNYQSKGFLLLKFLWIGSILKSSNLLAYSLRQGFRLE
jgi:hypothetical protein